MSYSTPRIKLHMSLVDIMVAMADGNPGAIRVLTELAKNAEKIDPDNALGPLGPLCALDNLDCYGSRIWMFYKDVCRQDIHKMMGVMRACGMGFTAAPAINLAIDGDKTALDIPDLLARLKKRLPKFQIEKPAEPMQQAAE